MTKDEVVDHCETYDVVEVTNSGAPSNIMSFSVGGKKFAYFKTSEPEKWRFSIRVTADRFVELTDQPGIKLARYMHRFHWITIIHVRQMDESYLKELITWSYEKAYNSLTKKRQRSLS